LLKDSKETDGPQEVLVQQTESLDDRIGRLQAARGRLITARSELEVKLERVNQRILDEKSKVSPNIPKPNPVALPQPISTQPIQRITTPPREG